MLTGLELPSSDFKEKTVYRFSMFETSSLGIKEVDITKNHPIERTTTHRADLYLFFQLKKQASRMNNIKMGKGRIRPERKDFIEKCCWLLAFGRWLVKKMLLAVSLWPLACFY
jgi:hypothetical protein